MSNPISFIYFGTSDFSVTILDELEAGGFLPTLVVTQEDKPQGRHLQITPPPVKVWAEKRNIAVYQPSTLKDGSALAHIRDRAPENGYDVAIVASYGKIIPDDILLLPKRETINVHPSLLPKLRGPSPIVGAILSEEKTGVSIMHLDSEMDHGPIIAQKEVFLEKWPPYLSELQNLLALEGGKLLSKILPDWVAGTIMSKVQEHGDATYTKKVRKTDAEINLSDSPNINLRKIRGYSGWPNAYTFFEHDGKRIRLIIISASIQDEKLVFERVIPEGKREMDFEEFARGLHTTKAL